jgi:hypothetical protein
MALQERILLTTINNSKSYLSSVKQVWPKTWRIFMSAEARMTQLVLNLRCNYHWLTAILSFRRQFHPPGLWKNMSAESLYKKNIKKNCRVFLHGFMMPKLFNIKKKHFFLLVRSIKLFFCASFVLNKYGFLKRKNWIRNLQIWPRCTFCFILQFGQVIVFVFLWRPYPTIQYQFSHTE